MNTHNTHKIKPKIILGILLSDPYNGKEEFLSHLGKNSFSVYSISSKIEEMAKYLLKTDNVADITQESIDDIRKKGYAVNKLYWINLLLTSIPEKNSYIIVKDLWQEDLYEGYITPIVSDPILVSNVNFVRFPRNASNVAEIKRWVDEIKEKNV